jgi:hypothetical protein
MKPYFPLLILFLVLGWHKISIIRGVSSKIPWCAPQHNKKYMEPITVNCMWIAVNCRNQGVVASYFLLNGWQGESQSVCWQGENVTFKATIYNWYSPTVSYRLQEKSLAVGLTNLQVLSILLDLFFNTVIFKEGCLRRQVQRKEKGPAFVGTNENTSRMKDTRSF